MSSSQLASILAAEEDKLLACVHCGLCLEACPTYTLTGNENDSPRGRIYLMRAVEEGKLSAGARAFERHINRCLGCRACEQACPAGVEYGNLLEAARGELYRKNTPRSWQSRFVRFVLRHVWLHSARLRAAFTLSRLARDVKIPRLLLKTKLAPLISPRFEFALALLDSSSLRKLAEDKNSNRKRDGHRAAASSVSEISNLKSQISNPQSEGLNSEDLNSNAKLTRALLFEGCVTEGLFSRVNRATARVLKVNGCETTAPSAQVCCGALHAHSGDLEGARFLARRNIEAFADEKDAPIITNAGGCGAMLVSYAHLLSDDEEYAEYARKFSLRVRDISQQLEATGIRAGAKLNDEKTTYDASCHLLYGQRAGDEPLRMLHAIPDLRFVPLEGSERCCGGAGIYNLLESEMSSGVLDEKIAHVKETGACVLATGNPGCHMQINAGAQARGLEDLRVAHPVELLDESYARAGFYDQE